MAQPYVGEVRMFAGNFAPAGWMFCEGQLLPISENEILFQLIGTTYGGDGQETFALPDLRGRLPMHQGNGFILAESGGVEEVTLTTQQIPIHTHQLIGTTNPADTPNVANGIPAAGTVSQLYWGDPPETAASPQAISAVGGNQPHTNFQPYLCVDFIISLFGIFPSPT
jgi:microcystin-dependent protein